MDDAGVYSNGLTGVRQVRMHAFEMIGTARFTGPRSLEVRLRKNSGVRASFREADDHDGTAHGRCRGDGK